LKNVPDLITSYLGGSSDTLKLLAVPMKYQGMS